MSNNLKRIRTVKAAKKILKAEKDHMGRPRYRMIRWQNNKKSFLVETTSGQRSRIFDVYIDLTYKEE